MGINEIPKPRIIKSLNRHGQKCKQYFYDFGDILVIHKYTLIPNGQKLPEFFGGQQVCKLTQNYAISFHRFSIKKETLLKGFDL